MTRRILLSAIVAAVALCVASASTQAQSDKSKMQASGKLVSLTPMPYSDLKSFVLKTPSGEEKFTVTEAAAVPRGLKPGDVVTVDYRLGENGLRWASEIKKASKKKAR